MTTAVYIDGFNLYYGIARPLHCKWVDLQSFFQSQFPADDIHKIYFFEALISGPNRINQEAYVKALRSLPKLEVVLGEMKQKSRHCKVSQCQHPGDRYWNDYEEKHTDVSIAITMIDDAHRGIYEKMILVTADTDLVPALRMIKTVQPPPQITLCVPALHKQRIWGTKPLAILADKTTRVNADALPHHQFPPTFQDATGTTHTMPQNWSIAASNAASKWKQANSKDHLPHLPSWCK